MPSPSTCNLELEISVVTTLAVAHQTSFNLPMTTLADLQLKYRLMASSQEQRQEGDDTEVLLRVGYSRDATVGMPH